MCVSRPTNDETNTTCLIFEAQDTQKQEEIITKSQKNSKEETFSFFLYQFKKKKPAHHHSTKLKVKKPIVAIVFSQLCPYCTHTILLTSWQHFSRGNRKRRTFLRGNNFVFSIGNCFSSFNKRKKENRVSVYANSLVLLKKIKTGFAFQTEQKSRFNEYFKNQFEFHFF